MSNKSKKASAGATPLKITDGALRVVEEVISTTHSSDRMEILGYVCDKLVSRYSSARMERHLTQMHMSTTDDVLRAIDIFIVLRSMDPTFTVIKTKAV